ncbi:mediator of RNA polymerase II transcription subunit 15 isoform X2 [Bradysia coprophila]|uniref:mediator of RNA polymerase II transcription subunit 15 isoform X2 n=1 Tax=Bradysia coprophila TaxID=38358 RepID=UPI00187DB81B|nr:mediator of RNA polymerase II transcription subunit 15 isoform X2 [Bradysia coprophila]
MGFLTSTLFLLIVVHKSVTIKIQQNDAQTSSPLQMQISDINLNQTERVRRLIPYMNFYVPISDYLPDNQAYSYNPTNGQKQQIHHKQSTIQNPQQSRTQPQQQQLNRPAVYNSNTKYASRRPQPQTAIYNTRHQTNKPFDLPIQQTQRVNYNYAKKQPTPFLATNQVPGDFRPIIYEEGLTAQNSYKGQTEQPIETQSVQYYDEEQYIPKQPQQQTKQLRPIIAQQYSHQRAPEPQLHQYYRVEDHLHQRQKAEIELQQQQQQQQQQQLQQQQLQQQQLDHQQLDHQQLEHQQLQQQQNILSQPIHVDSSTTPAPRQEQHSPNYVTYLQPQNFVQFIKSTTPKPIGNGKNVVYKIVRPTPKPPTQYVVYQHTDEPQQPKQIFRHPADAENTRNIVPDGNQIYHKANNEYEQQSQQEPAPVYRIQAENKPTYRLKEFYTLDPNDGYGSRIPTREQLTQAAANPHVPKKQFIPYNPASTTPVPVTTTSTQRYYPQKQTDDENYQDISEEPSFRPTIPTSTVALHHQHLTETSNGHAPTSAPAYHSSSPSRQYRPYSAQPKVKFIPRYQSPANVPIVQVQPNPTPSTSVSHASSEYGSTSVSEVLRKLQETNLLPQTLNAENIDDSIQTLVQILNNLKQSQYVAEIPPQQHQSVDYPEPNDDDAIRHQSDYDEVNDKPNNEVNSSGESPGPNTGRPGIDYPNLSEIPQTNFNCKEQRYKGFFGDPETHCQVWHYCDLNGGQASFLCPNGTIFSQVALTCDWWFNVKCSTTTQLYVLNERLYKYILPFSPKFPEDYSGPVVDKYLAIKFQEMEEKMMRQKQKGKQSVKTIPPQQIKESQRDDEIDVDPTYSSDAQLDDEGQSHNIDNAIQHPVYKYESTSVAIPNNRYSSTTEFIVPKGRTFATATTPRTKVEIESEKVEVIEIKSDGSTGHLIPDNYAK